MDMVVATKILALKDRIVSKFDKGNWIDVGLLTGLPEVIDGHSRLLRSLSFGDDDYDGNVGEVLFALYERDKSALMRIETYLDRKFPARSEFVSAAPAERRISFAPIVFQVPTVAVEADFVAVMMPFASGFAKVYEAIQAACKDSGFRVDRADNVWEHPTIIQDIFELIFRARIVICDFSGKNPNVMYECGIAHTLGKQVIPLSQSMDDVPFDVKHHRVLTYLNNGEGLTAMHGKLASKLKAMA